MPALIEAVEVANAVRDGDLRQSFAERGYVGPVPLFSQRECGRILARLRRDQARPPLDWHKGSAPTSLEHFGLATDDRVLDLVTALIGEDVLLWGTYLVKREIGQVHPWHTDIESSSPDAETVTVWIGLANTTARSSLTVVPFSHRFGLTVQEVMMEKGADPGRVSDDDVANWARERDRRSGVELVGAVDGEALLFDGRLWHGSRNRARRGQRYAVLLQYATPRTAIRIPRRAVLPFDWHRTPRPPCIVVSGSDVGALNRLVPGPTPRHGSRMTAVSARIHPLELPLEQDPEAGWKAHSLFRGATPDVKEMRCHASVLDPDRQPHPPHRHDDEEVLVILDGEADLVWGDAGDPARTVKHRAERGTFAYYPAGFPHTIHNPTGEPVTYLMFKWRTDRRERGDDLEQSLVPLPATRAGTRGDAVKDFSAKRVLDGQTRYLRHLHSHLTTLQPGAGYAPHVDAYDVGIVVLEGIVETLGEQVGPNGVIFYAAGEPHGMKNVGDGPAVYLVFEFHGRHSTRYAPSDRRLSRGLWAVARDPRLLKRALAPRLRLLVRSVRRRVTLR